MKNAFDQNVPRLRPLGGQKKAAAVVAAPPASAPVEAPPAPAAEAAPAGATAPEDAAAAAERLRAHMQSRARKAKPAEPLAGAVKARQARPAPTPAPEELSRAELAHSIAAAVAGAMAGPASASTPVADETLARGQERIARLRDRLQAAERSGAEQEPLEPRAATEATRQMVDGFRARLRALAEERDALEGALAGARHEVQQLRAQVAEVQHRLEAAEATARERVELARGLMAETESLAAERDQALARIAELKALDEQQTRLIGQAEAALVERDDRLAGLEARLQEQARLQQARAAELAELTGRVARRTAERDEQLARVQALESEVQALQESRLALAEIKRMVEAAKL